MFEEIDEAEKKRIAGNISYVNSLKELGDSELTIEAIIENLAIKQKVFSELESYVSESYLISNSPFKNNPEGMLNALFSRAITLCSSVCSAHAPFKVINANRADKIIVFFILLCSFYYIDIKKSADLFD